MDKEMVDHLLAETRRHFDGVAEGLRGEIRQLAEGVAALDSTLREQIGGLRSEMKKEFGETRAVIASLTRRATTARGPWNPRSRPSERDLDARAGKAYRPGRG
jgi:hypothetical protein